MSALLFDVASHHRGKYLEPRLYLMWKYLPKTEQESKSTQGTDLHFMQYPHLYTRCQREMRSKVTRLLIYFIFLIIDYNITVKSHVKVKLMIKKNRTFESTIDIFF